MRPFARIVLTLCIPLLVSACGTCAATDLIVSDHPAHPAPAKRLCWTCDDNDERVCIDYKKPGETWRKCLEATK